MKSSYIPERINAACNRLAGKHGFYRMTVDDLVRETGISKRTIYHYYRSKEEIIESTLDSFIREITLEIDMLLQHEAEPIIIVKTLLDILVDKEPFLFNSASLYDLQKHYPHLWYKIDQFQQERINQIIEVVKFHNSNNACTDINMCIFTAMISASVKAVLNPTFILENNLVFQEATGELSNLLMRLFWGNKATS